MKTTLELYGPQSHYDKTIKKVVKKPLNPVLIDETEQEKLKQVIPKQITPHIAKGGLNLLA